MFKKSKILFILLEKLEDTYLSNEEIAQTTFR